MQKEQEVIQILKDYRKELQELLDQGKTLREISQYSFHQRESGRNIPYLAITDTDQSKNILRITASPTSKQKDLTNFFAIKAEGFKVLYKYRFYIESSVQFYSVFKNNQGNLSQEKI